MATPELIRADASVWLRRVTPADAQALFDGYASDPHATYYLGWPTRTDVSEVASWLRPALAGWDDGTYRRWVIVTRPDGNAVGTISLRHDGDAVRVGCGLSPGHTGRGVATCAVRRLLSWWDEHGDGRPVRATCHPDNATSVRVLAKCGFKLVSYERAAGLRPNIRTAPSDVLMFERRGRPSGTRTASGVVEDAAGVLHRPLAGGMPFDVTCGR